MKGAEKTTIIFHVTIDRTREAVGVNAIAIRLVVLFVAWVVHQQSIGRGRTTNNNSNHRMGLMFGTFDIAVLFVVEIAEQEKWNPRPLVMANSMNQQERRSKTAMDPTRNGIHHAGCVDDSIKPESPRHLLFGKIGTCRMDHNLLMRLNKAIRRLSLGGRSNDL